MPVRWPRLGAVKKRLPPITRESSSGQFASPPQQSDRGRSPLPLSSHPGLKSKGIEAMDMATVRTPAPAALAAKGKTASAGSALSVVERACRFIEARVDDGERFTLAELGAHCGLSPWHLQRQFRQAMGVTPRAYGDQRRLARFRDELQQGEGVAAATYGAGYGSSSRVYERADGLIGMTPATYAKGGKGAQIAYGIADSPLGRLLAAATGRGICFVGLGD